MELNIMERVKLLEVLPKESDLLTLKILRKLRESLSFSEEELKTFDVVYEYACPHRDDDDGKITKCENRGYFRETPTCSRHNVLMLPTGQMNLSIPPEAIEKSKDIHMGTQALQIVSNALKHMNDQRLLTEAHISLYEKFFPPEEKEG